MRKIIAILICVFSLPAYAISVIEDTEIESVITELIEPVTAAAKIPNARVRIVNDDNFNAFVSGGTDIYIYTGLLTRIRTPNALRAVVAHELGHTIGGHMAQLSARMESEMKRTMVIQALGIGLMLAGGNPSLGAGVMAGASGIAQQSMLAFSRDEERVADDMGFDLMVRAGYNPNGFIDVFEQMKDMTEHIESRINPNAINHPLTAERLKNVRDKLASSDIKDKKFKYDTATTKGKYDMVRAKLVGYLDGSDRIKTLYPSSDKSDAALYARAIANMRWGNLSGAGIGARTLIARNPKNPYFYELLGDLEYKYGHYDDAVDAYERALDLRPNSPQIQVALALVLTERNRGEDKSRAAELCRRAILSEPTPLAYWVLARTFDPDDGRTDWAMAEYYRLQNNREKSREYARRAKTRLNKKSPEYIKSDDILKESN